MSQETIVPNKTAWGTLVLLGFALALAMLFMTGVAFPYFTLNPEKFGVYWSKRGWLLLHICGGIVALASGPFVLWLGLNRRRMTLHRGLGVAYMSSVALSSTAAFYLAFHTTFGWVFGSGLAALAIAWILTTGLAFAAIRRRLIAQHKEWMIRSYVVTFAFVNFRICAAVLQSAGIGTFSEQLSAASWFCWSVPLLITEVFLQGRKIFSGRPARQVARVMPTEATRALE